MNIAGYTESEILYDSGRSKIYRIYNKETGSYQILKTPGSLLSLDKAKVIYKSEFKIGSSLDSNLHLKYIEHNESQGKPYILTEDFGAISLKMIIPEKGLEIGTFFKYAIQIVDAVAQLHHKKIIHKDICPGNIVVNPKTGLLKLIDFGSASNFIKEIGDNKSVLTHATLTFISPEQTGRINRLVTYKTDFYSIGITFFNMLTGRYPFTSKESSELIYQHIAAEPPQLKQINPSLPAQLDEIVLKLMRKNPDERYSSALGLLHDLKKSFGFWDDIKAIPIFPLGEDDVSEIFSIPEKLYGREEELKKAKGYFSRAQSGKFTVCYIEGQSGIGKSAFVSELYKEIIKEKGNFGSGKFDQFQRNVPYSALIQALNQIIQQILIESPESISRWKTILQDTLGTNAGLLASVLPDLKLIMGEIEMIEVADPALAKNRFVLAFKNLIKSFSQPDSPLVLFLDDLQWIDAATLQLFTDYFNSIDTTEKNYTLIAGAYRDNEVGDDHPLAVVLRDFENRGFPKKTIKLEPLGKDAITALCSEAMGREPNETTELVTLLHSKTGGSPFFVKQFLESLYARDFIYLNRENRNWSWHINKVKETSFTDNVVDLIQKKLHQLDPDVQLILKIASCLGQNFEAADIVQISQKEGSQVDQSLVKAMDEDIIYKLYSEEGDVYRFQHDRIQNAAYTLIEKHDLDELHYSIGIHLKQKPDIPSEHTEKLFDWLQHLNRNDALVGDKSLRLELSRSNLEAGNIARKSNAHQAALVFANKGIGFMPSDLWVSQPDLSRDLHLMGAQSAHLIGKFEELHLLTDQAIPNLSNPIDKANFHEIVAYSYTSRREWQKAVEEALQGLKILDLNLPRNPGKGHVMKYLAKFFLVMGRRKPEDLINLPDLVNPKVEAAIKLFISAVSPAYLTNQNMFAIVFTEMARLSAKHGNSRYAAFCYVGFGVFLGGALGYIDYGFRFGQLGEKVFNKYRSDELMAKIYFSLFAFLQNWKIDVKKLYPKLLEGFQVGSQVGENEYAAWCISMRAGMSSLSGENLEQVEKDLLSVVKFSDNLKQIQIIAIGFLDYTSWWLEKGLPENNPLSEEYVDNKTPVFIKEKFWTAVAEHDLTVGSMLFHYFQYEKAWAFLSRGWQHHTALTGLFYYSQLAFYRAWCAIKIKQEKPEYFTSKELTNIIKDFTKWGIHSPPNHGHKLKMFDAELAVINGEKAQAMDFLDEAILQAAYTDHPNDQALFCEMAANHYRKWGKESFADVYILQAYNAYVRWGAVRKINSLEISYPFLKQRQSTYARLGKTGETVMSEEIFSAMDVESIVKSSQAISSEIQVDALIDRLMKLLSETAGAQRVIILLKRKGELRIEALKEIGKEAETKKIPIEEFHAIPMSVINYIEKTKSTVLLENAHENGPFTRDPYIINGKAKSILGIPIVKQGNLGGIIYMDNSLASGVFSAQRADVLATLSSQVAISLENANSISRMQELNISYNRFVPNVFLKMLNRESILDVKPGDQEYKEMIILFADIRNFTTYSATIPAEETFTMLNKYLTTVTPAIHDNGGTIDKFIGDGIMAIFPNDADKALRAAVQMKQALEEYNLERQQNNEPAIHIGVGLHIGNITLGTVGTEDRLSTTVIGDPVNLASRLEAYTKINKSNIQISGELNARLVNPSEFNLRKVGYLIAKGKTNKIELIEEYSNKSAVDIQQIQLHQALFSKAIDSFDKEDFEKAELQFEKYLNQVPSDEVAQYYYKTCKSRITK